MTTAISLNSTLTTAESRLLVHYEAVIEAGLCSFVDVGNALIEISDGRLYRATHSTFKEYVGDKWKMTAARAYQLAEAAQVMKEVEKSTIVDKPKNEAQARELAKAPKGKRAEVMEQAAATAPAGKVTAQHIASAVKTAAAPVVAAAPTDTAKPAATISTPAPATPPVHPLQVLPPARSAVPPTEVAEVLHGFDLQLEEILAAHSDAEDLNRIAVHLEIISRKLKTEAKKRRRQVAHAA